MELIDSATIKRVRDARPIIDDLQERLYKAESALDDLVRAVEIAKYSGQPQVVDVYCKDAEKLLEDRLELPDSSVFADKMSNTVVTGTLNEQTVKDLQGKTI